MGTTSENTTKYVSFLLDETGSMNNIKEDTIGGFNEYVDTLKKDGADTSFLRCIHLFAEPSLTPPERSPVSSEEIGDRSKGNQTLIRSKSGFRGAKTTRCKRWITI